MRVSVTAAGVEMSLFPEAGLLDRRVRIIVYRFWGQGADAESTEQETTLGGVTEAAPDICAQVELAAS